MFFRFNVWLGLLVKVGLINCMSKGLCVQSYGCIGKICCPFIWLLIFYYLFYCFVVVFVVFMLLFSFVLIYGFVFPPFMHRHLCTAILSYISSAILSYISSAIYAPPFMLRHLCSAIYAPPFMHRHFICDKVKTKHFGKMRL